MPIIIMNLSKQLPTIPALELIMLQKLFQHQSILVFIDASNHHS